MTIPRSESEGGLEPQAAEAASLLPRRLRSRHGLAWALRFADMAGIIFIYELVFWVRTGDFTTNLLHSQRWLAVAAVVMTALYLFDCHRVDRHQPRWHLPLRALAASASGGLVIGLLIYLVGPELIGSQYNVLGRTVLIPALALFGLYAGAVRVMARTVVDRESGRMRWLVIGRRDSEGLGHFWRAFQRQDSLGDAVILADGEAAVSTSEAAGLTITGGWADLDTQLKHRWSGVILAGGWELPDAMIEQLMRARLGGMRIYDLGEFYERAWEKLPVYHLQRGWFALTAGFALLHEPASARLKRWSDVVLSSLLLLLASPVLVLVYLAVRFDSSGPGFFSQTRVGRGGAVFTCYKFRTMRVGAEAGSMYTDANDQRITRIGRFLRSSRLDEFPQLWNVLRGDMSLIGPRAEWTKCVADYEHVIPFYHLRHLVRPGITGWAQVNYSYGASVDDAREKLEYDLYYLKNHSLALDLVILLRTVKVVLFGRGAR